MEHMNESTSDKIIKLLKHWPFSKLTIAQHLEINKEKRTLDNISLPENDRMELLVYSFPLLIPADEKDKAIEIINDIAKKHGIYVRHPNKERIKSGIEKFKINNRARYMLSSFRAKKDSDLNFNYININLVQISESFICICFTMAPNDKLKYDFQKLINFEYTSKTILHKPKLKNIFKHWGFTTYPPRLNLKKNFYNFLMNLEGTLQYF